MSWALWAPEPPDPLSWATGTPWNGRDATLARMPGQGSGVLFPLGQSPIAPPQTALSGWFQPVFDLDFYNRLHLSITTMALGNVVGEQQRIVSVWNAFSYGVRLDSLVLANGEGIELVGQAPPPLAFGPLQERAWSVRVSADGPPTIDATVSWGFDTGTTLVMHITGNRVSPWTWRPDWSRGIGESLEWRTDVMTSEEGDEQRVARRLTPRQTWDFTATATDVERQAMEAALLGWTARAWALPLWPHGADLQADVAAGDRLLQLPSTLGREFVTGGLALLLGEDAFTSEVVEVDQVLANGLQIKRDLARAWPAGTVVYPAKSARITDAGVVRFTGSCSDASVTFEVASANPYPSIDPATLPQHRGLPVLEDRPDWSVAPTLNPERRLAITDNGDGVPRWVDRSGYPVMRQTLRYAPLGRSQIDRLRQLQYYLAGQQRPLWVPSYANDMDLQALAAPGATNLDIAFMGYTAYLRGLVGRTDIRIETPAGIQYRQITGSTDLGNGRERIGLAAPLQLLLDPAAGVQISFLSVMRGNSDRLEWAWWSGDMGGDNAHADSPMPMRTYRHEF